MNFIKLIITGKHTLTHMNLIATTKNYIQQIFASVPGMKILLVDQETIKLIQLIFTKSEIMEYEVFVVDLMQKQRKVPFALDAVCLLRPNAQNMGDLINELHEPSYQKYHLFFTNMLSDMELRLIAKADCNHVVHQIHEYYMNYIPETNNVYHLNCLMPVSISYSADKIDTICDGLSSLLLSIKKTPLIRYQQSSDICARVATSLKGRMEQHPHMFNFPRTQNTTTLLILDRLHDPVTPLLTQWTYQAMIHQAFHIDFHTVTLPGKSSPTILSPSTDDFYRTNMYNNWGQVCSNIKCVLENTKNNKAELQNIQSIENIKEFMAEFPEYTKLKDKISKHIDILEHLGQYINSNQLLDISILEQELACNDDHTSAIQKLYPLVENSTINVSNKLRLILLYALRYETHPNQKILDLLMCVKEKENNMAPDTITRFLKHVKKLQSSELFQTKGWVEMFTESVCNMREIKNLYTQHTPVLTRLVSDITKGCLNTITYPCTTNTIPKPHHNIIIFIIGGVTYEETCHISKLNTANILIGGTHIHNSFLSDLVSTSA